MAVSGVLTKIMLQIPASVAASLPPYTHWELTVVSDGLHLRYIGECEPNLRENRHTIALPFLKGDTA